MRRAVSGGSHSDGSEWLVCGVKGLFLTLTDSSLTGIFRYLGEGNCVCGSYYFCCPVVVMQILSQNYYYYYYYCIVYPLSKNLLYDFWEENDGEQEWLEHQNVYLLNLNMLDTYHELVNGDRVE